MSFIYNQNADGQQIHYDTYKATASKLMEGLTSNISMGENSSSNSAVAYMRNNIYCFSGAKNISEQNELRALLFKEDGSVKPFNQFKKDVQGVINNYETKYLEAEYNYAVAAGTMSEKWQTLWANREAYPYLQYRTVEDDRVRPEHAILDNIVLPITSTEWNRMYPPNGWNCRCTVIPSKNASRLSDEKEVGQMTKPLIKGMFNNNVGKTYVVFDEKNIPMFKNIKGNIQHLDPIKNYNLSIPKLNTLTRYEEVKSVEAYESWWDKMMKENGTGTAKDFMLKDLLQTEIIFEGAAEGIDKTMFKDHVLINKNEKRYEYIGNLKSLLSQPHEVWSQMVDDVQLLFYIQYYAKSRRWHTHQ